MFNGVNSISDIELVGYHGTLQSKAKKIIKGTFIISTKKTEWLGQGIYFFGDRRDAKYWAEQEAKKPHNRGEQPYVLRVDIICSESEYMDLDIEDSLDYFDKTLEEIHPKRSGPNFKSNEQARCYYCDLFKRVKGVKVLAYTFPRMTRSKWALPRVEPQRQICVANNDYIKNKRGEYDEQVI